MSSEGIYEKQSWWVWTSTNMSWPLIVHVLERDTALLNGRGLVHLEADATYNNVWGNPETKEKMIKVGLGYDSVLHV